VARASRDDGSAGTGVLTTAGMKQLLKSRKELIVLIAALLAHLILLSAQALQAQTTPLLRSWSLEVVAPMLQRFTGSLGLVSRVWYGYLDLRTARRENRYLKDQVAEFRQAIIEYEEKQKESERLNILSSLESELKLPAVKARVIGWDSNQWFSSRIIDKGSHAGLGKDCAVLCPGGVVGRVLHASTDSAVVQLITDSDSGMGVLMEHSRAQGVMKGTGKNHAYIDYISSSEKVVPGEKVLTSGLDQIYPKGLLVGYAISSAISKQVFQRVEVSVSADLQKLEEVLVLKKLPKD
jgi:rod shape-determining protein MreC